jgi:hypothetical protein
MADISDTVQESIAKYRNALDNGMPQNYSGRYEFLSNVIGFKNEYGLLKLRGKVIKDKANPTEMERKMLYEVVRKEYQNLPNRYAKACKEYSDMIAKNPGLVKEVESETFTPQRKEEFRNKYQKVCARYPFTPEFKGDDLGQSHSKGGEETYHTIQFSFIEPVDITKNTFRKNIYNEGFQSDREDNETEIKERFGQIRRAFIEYMKKK